MGLALGRLTDTAKCSGDFSTKAMTVRRTTQRKDRPICHLAEAAVSCRAQAVLVKSLVVMSKPLEKGSARTLQRPHTQARVVGTETKPELLT